MTHRPAAFVLLPLLALAVAPTCKPRHEPHVHAAAPETSELDPTSVTVFGKQALLFLEYPHLVVGEPARFLAHFSVLADGEPVRSGQVTLRIGVTTLTANAPKRDGIFIPEGSVPKAGRFSGELTVTSEQVKETFALGEMVVHPDLAAARATAEAAAGEEPPGAVPFLLEQQWKVKLLLAPAVRQSLVRRLVVPAQARTPEGAEAIVAPPLAGRLLAPTSGRLPVTGDQVAAGQEIGFIEPPLSAPDLAQLEALRLEFDLKALDVARAIGQAKARLNYSQRERERIGKLREKGLSTQQQLDEAEQNLALAQGEAASARATQESLDRLLAARPANARSSALPTSRFPLIAPLSGAVIASGHVNGESVADDEPLFRILDTTRMWVEGRISEFDLPLLGETSGALVSFAALPGTRLDVGADTVAAGATKRAFFLSPIVDSASRTVTIRCEVENPQGAIRAGMLAEIALATGKADAAVVLPADAIVLDQGTPTVYVMLEGELFQRRELELGVKDGDWVEIRRGIAVGEHVATRGAYSVKLAALSPTSFGAGHQH